MFSDSYLWAAKDPQIFEKGLLHEIQRPNRTNKFEENRVMEAKENCVSA